MEEVQETCHAILEQGEKKGSRCWRPILNGGYCGKHKTQAILEKGKASGKKKCKRYRCATLIENGSTNPYCASCQEQKKKERESIKLCVAIVQQHNNKGNQCDKAASNGEYCGKHYEFNARLKEAAQKKIRICDDGKRACKQPTLDGKLRCEDCLAKARESDAAAYSLRQMDLTKCLGCGITIEKLIKGKWGKEVQQCIPCYEKQRKIEEMRERDMRDYNQERQANPERHINEYISSSYKRGKPFELTNDEFQGLVCGPCAYCGIQCETVHGIDRIDSEKGYTAENTVSCCALCNHMKGTLAPNELKEHITKMYLHMNKDASVFEKADAAEKSLIGKSWKRPSEILAILNSKKINEYIQWCKEDARSPAFIEKLEELKGKTMNYIEILAYIKNALRTEANKQKKTITNTRQRISKEELFGFLEIGAAEKCIEHYEAAHGKSEKLNEEFQSLKSNWKDFTKEEKYSALTKTLLRLQNLRNRPTAATQES